MLHAEWSRFSDEIIRMVSGVGGVASVVSTIKVRSLRFLWRGYVSKAALRKWERKKFLTIVTAARSRGTKVFLVIFVSCSRGLEVGKKKKVTPRLNYKPHVAFETARPENERILVVCDIRCGWKCNKLFLPVVVYGCYFRFFTVSS